MLYYASLNSGSNGNCYYAGNETEGILIDAGIHCKAIEERMSNLNLDIRKLRAIFISHEHTDHIRGVYKLAKKYQLPVYISPGTWQRSFLGKSDIHTLPIAHHEKIIIGNIAIIPFSKSHDAADPFSFSIIHDNARISVITDIGHACENVIEHFSKSQVSFIEANYDDELLLKGKYPFYLKQRIRSEVGHLSNMEALELFRKHKKTDLRHLILSHLSKENNSPELVQQLFENEKTSVRIDIAPRYNESKLFLLQNNEVSLISGQLSIF